MQTNVLTEQVYTRTLRLMGNRFSISVVKDDAREADFLIDEAISEIRRIEALLTTFSPDSETNRINAAAGLHPVMVSSEVFELIRRSLRLSALTQGAFDITYGSLDRSLWNFDTSMTALPDAVSARRSVSLIDYRNVILDESRQTVFLKNKGMLIGFGGIGKGYAAEMAKKRLVQLGANSGIVNASGDLAAWGRQPNGRPWTIAIADPNTRTEPFSAFEISDMAVATSGNYEKYVMIGGKRYSHTINPKTGLPIAGIKSVTVICPNAEIADALTTPVSIMGVRAGLHLINQIKQVACIVIDDHDQLFTSRNISFRP